MAVRSRPFGRYLLGALLLGLAECAAVLGLSVAATGPAAAQFDDRFPFMGQRHRPNSGYNNGGFFGGFGNFGDQPRPAPVVENNTKAPSPARKTSDSPPLTSVTVLGDSMADWLAYGLEQAAVDSPDIGILRRHRSYSGLIRIEVKNDPRGEYPDWPPAAREILNGDKVDFVVMMVGLNDRRPIREKAPAKPADKDGKKDAKKNSDKDAKKESDKDAKKDSEKDTKKDAEKDAELDNDKDASTDESPATPAEPVVAGMVTYEFRSDKWTDLYIKRIDETIAALKAKNVPVFWVGLPPVRSTKMSADLGFLNDLYRGRAEKAGITYIDTWDGFVDESGRFVMSGPDFEGQTRRLRSPDGIHFTQAGARKLAHYVEREVQRALMSHATPVALPAEEPAPQAPAAKPGAAAMARPLAGPVIPLTATADADELVGGGSTRQAAVDDAIAARVLVRGEAAQVPAGRADDAVWPRRGVAPLGADPVVATTTIPMTPMQGEQPRAVAAAAAGSIGPQRPAGPARPSVSSRQFANAGQRSQYGQQQGSEQRSVFPSSRPFFFPFFGR